MNSHPYRTAVYRFKLTLPTAPDGPEKQPVEFNFARKINVFANDACLKREAKLEFVRWCEKHLEITVETKLIGTVGDLARHYEEKVNEAATAAADALWLADNSDYKTALYDVLRALSPGTLTRLEEGKYRPKED